MSYYHISFSNVKDLEDVIITKWLYLYSAIPDVSTTNVCKGNCMCDNTAFFPTCGADGVTYFSPCHAGCLHLEGMVCWYFKQSLALMLSYYKCGILAISYASYNVQIIIIIIFAFHITYIQRSTTSADFKYGYLITLWRTVLFCIVDKINSTSK